MYNQVKAGIMNVYDANDENGLKNYLEDKLYFGEAPDDALEPYAVYQLNFPENFRDSADGFETGIMQINIYDKSENSVNIANMAVTAQNTFDNLQEVITLPAGIYVNRIKRDFVRFIPRVDLVWAAVLQYRINIQLIKQ